MGLSCGVDFRILGHTVSSSIFDFQVCDEFCSLRRHALITICGTSLLWSLKPGGLGLMVLKLLIPHSFAIAQVHRSVLFVNIVLYLFYSDCYQWWIKSNALVPPVFYYTWAAYLDGTIFNNNFMGIPPNHHQFETSPGASSVSFLPPQLLSSLYNHHAPAAISSPAS